MNKNSKTSNDINQLKIINKLVYVLEQLEKTAANPDRQLEIKNVKEKLLTKKAYLKLSLKNEK